MEYSGITPELTSRFKRQFKRQRKSNSLCSLVRNIDVIKCHSYAESTLAVLGESLSKVFNTFRKNISRRDSPLWEGKRLFVNNDKTLHQVSSPARTDFCQRLLPALPPVQGPLQHSFWDPAIDIFDPPKVLSPYDSRDRDGNSCDRRLICRRKGYQENQQRKIRFQRYQTDEIRKALQDWLASKPGVQYTTPTTPEIIPGGTVEFIMTAGAPLEIGRGVYGCVFLGRLGISGNKAKIVAIKLFKKKNGTNEADIIREAAIMQHLNDYKVSPHLFGVTVIEENPFYEQWALVLEFIGNDHTFQIIDMASLIRAEVLSRKLYGYRSLHWFEVIDILRRILQCMRRIHQCGIVLNDLKTNNILFRKLNGVYIPYITDFGLSKYGDYTMDYSAGKSEDIKQRWSEKYWHIDPDLFKRGECFSEHDIYSFGVILRETGNALSIPEIVDIAKGILSSQTRDRCTFQPYGSATLIKKLQVLTSRIPDRRCCCHTNLLGSKVDWHETASTLSMKWQNIYMEESCGLTLTSFSS